MFKSVFAKYITAFALIIFVSFLMLSSIITSMISSYAIDEKTENVKWISNAITGVVRESFIDHRNESGPGYSLTQYVMDEYGMIENIIDRFTEEKQDHAILITNASGDILYSSQDVLSGAITKISADIMTTLSTDSTYTDNGTLGGVLRSRHISQGRAIFYDNFQGAVIVCCSVESENALVSLMIRSVIMACLWIMLAALIAVYFISDRISSPLKSMIAAAKGFARGNFDTRVEVVGHDEIADLAVAFNNMAESLGQLDKMRNSFLANVSHDLRTPMTTIAGFIDGINDGAIPPEKHRYYLDIIATEIRRLSRLVSQLLDVSRLESGDRKFKFEPFDICEMGRLILISFEQKIDEKRLEIGFDCSSDKLMALGDKDAIYQIFYNLFENAVKFSRESGALNVTISEQDQFIRVSVYNEGNGISAEDLPFVFERFYKSDKSRGLDKTGVGLGLYISKTIIEAHKGNISVRSEEGKFCEFTFNIHRAPSK